MRAWIAAAAALLLGAGSATAQDKGSPCKVAHVTTGYHCDPCKRTLTPNDMREGVCKRCDEEPRKIEFCARRHNIKFVSACRHKKSLDRPFRCCGKVWNRYTFSEDLAKVVYTCRTCKAASGSRNDLVHKEGCDNPFGIDRACEKSGKKPHVD